jgi:2,4-dienoyl-CoA reductase-like NADH-dependent reductase (Old Yellow Enzyme family)
MAGLFDPIQVGPLSIPNRIVMPPMDLQHATEKGDVTDPMVEHYGKRAAGGVGLVIVEHSYVRPEGLVGRKQLGNYDDSQVVGLKRIAHAIKDGGAISTLQISHGGRQAPSELTGVQPVSASPLVSPGDPEMPRALSVEEIADFVESYGDAACRAREAGFDAVEIHGAHGYLLNQFVSPYSNQRDDVYGGSLESRMRFPLAVVESVRRKAGEDYPVFYRMSASEFVTGGLTLEETGPLARRLVEAGVQLIDVSGGIPASFMVGTGQVEGLPGYMVPLSAGIKRLIRAPAITVGRLNSPLMAADIIDGSQADFAGVARELLRVPGWPQRAKEALSQPGVETRGDRFRNYRREMEHVLMSHDIDSLRTFCQKWSTVYDDHMLRRQSRLPDDKLTVLMRKSISVSQVIDPDTIELSRQWLSERGYGTMPD